MKIPISICLVAIAFLIGAAHAADPGAKVYEAKCANCHGKNGEGTKKYKQALAGDRSLAQLTKLIIETMPENDPKTLSVEDGKAVSQFVYDSFYSPIARERNRPARIDLARLTVRQYRNAIADVFASFRNPAPAATTHGLKGEYYKNRRFRGTDRVLERTDAQVAFQFGTDTPVPEKTESFEFSIRWSGSLLPTETGTYQFVVRTEHAIRLWINDTNKPLIDAWVKSGNDTEYTGSIYLVGGRIYPLKLEYSKAKQGVDDSNKTKTKPPPVKSSVTMLWKVPQRGVVEVIPARHLTPENSSEQFLCTTPFPPDDRSYGWERGTSISKEWELASIDAALEAANYALGRVDEIAGKSSGADRQTKLKSYAERFAIAAVRRPLTPEQKALLIDQPFEKEKDPELAMKRSVLLTLLSPFFLYREVAGGNDAYDIASRLSFSLWDSIPDKTLLAEAAAGRLKSREQVIKQVERMQKDPRAKAKMRSFLLTWLNVDQDHDLMKDPKQFPGFDAALISDLRSSLEITLDEIANSEKADYRQLLLEPKTQMNGRMAKYYGVKLPDDAPFQKVDWDNGKRVGVLSHPYMMTTFAHTADSSPIHRGVFLARGILGVALKPPPEAITPVAAALHPSLTTRDRVVLQTKSAACMTCHSIINPLGFPFEHFDAVGRYRETEQKKPINAEGSYLTREGKVVNVKGVVELAKFLANSPESQAAFCEQMFHNLVQQPMLAYGANTEADLRNSFAKNDYNMRQLAAEIAVLAALPPKLRNAANTK